MIDVCALSNNIYNDKVNKFKSIQKYMKSIQAFECYFFYQYTFTYFTFSFGKLVFKLIIFI